MLSAPGSPRSARCRSSKRAQVSTTIVDRNGKLLRAFAMADGRWRLPVDARTDVDPGYLKLLLAYEDRRFYSHVGVDPLALARAALQLVDAGPYRLRRLDDHHAIGAADGAAQRALGLRQAAADGRARPDRAAS